MKSSQGKEDMIDFQEEEFKLILEQVALEVDKTSYKEKTNALIRRRFFASI